MTTNSVISSVNGVAADITSTPNNGDNTMTNPAPATSFDDLSRTVNKLADQCEDLWAECSELDYRIFEVVCRQAMYIYFGYKVTGALTKEQYEYLKNPSNCDGNECLDFDCLDDADYAETVLENVFDVLEECNLPAPDEEVDIQELRKNIVNELLDRCAPLSARDGVRVIERLSVMLRHLPE